MGKRMMRLMAPAVAGLLALSLGTAHAALSLEIATEDGAVVWSLPTLPAVGEDQLAYPDAFPTAITGSATFDGTDAIGVSYRLLGEENGDTIVMYSGGASLTCGAPDEAGGVSCTWSASIPFTFGPGNYEAEVTASQPDTDPIVKSINITIV